MAMARVLLVMRITIDGTGTKAKGTKMVCTGCGVDVVAQ